MSISKKLMVIQGALKAPKSQYNGFGKYNYRNCEDILEAVKPLCYDGGVVLTITDTVELIGNRFYIKATAKVACIDTGETMEVSAYAREEENKKGMDSAQVTGATSSYARKYALNGLFCIDDTKDADHNNNGSQNGSNESKKPYLTVNSSEWNNVVNWLRAGNSIENLKSSFTLTKDVVKALQEAMK